MSVWLYCLLALGLASLLATIATLAANYAAGEADEKFAEYLRSQQKERERDE